MNIVFMNIEILKAFYDSFGETLFGGDYNKGKQIDSPDN